MDMENSTNRNKAEEKHAADFETAISSTGYGVFNILLLILGIPSCLATSFETSTMSYILPSAECDLKLTLIDKGVLNAITYAGMITSAILWGFLADTLGRKKLLVWGFLLTSICDIFCALSRNFLTLLAFKFLGGFLICGPFAVLMSFLTEFHGTKQRGHVMMLIGIFFSLSNVSLPGIAWAILPLDINWSFFNGFIVMHSWNLFLIVCSLPSLTGGILAIFFPESPKFLMSRGRNEEALQIFKTIYCVNTRKSADTYPVKELELEIVHKSPAVSAATRNCDVTSRQSFLIGIRDGLYQLKPMFQKPYLGYSLHVYTIQFCVLNGVNTLRLWIPQLFNMLAVFEDDFTAGLLRSDKEPSTLCDMIEYSLNKSEIAINMDKDCIAVINTKMYMNTITVGLVGLGGYFVAGFLINAIGNKRIMIIVLFVSGTCAFFLYFAKNSIVTVTLSSIFVALGSIGSTALLGVCVNLFPTNMRTMIVSLAMMFGRTGALLGNVFFPILLSVGCLPPFIMVGSIMMVSSFLCFFLPVTHKDPLK